MAALPLEAFKEGDPPVDDPAYFYPPGVVPVSYLYGPPPDLAEYYSDIQRQQIDPSTGLPIGNPPLPDDERHPDNPPLPVAPPPSSAERPDYVPFLNSEGAGEGEIPFLGRNIAPVTTQPEYDAAEDDRPEQGRDSPIFKNYS
jgi:hypothetical protein